MFDKLRQTFLIILWYNMLKSLKGAKSMEYKELKCRKLDGLGRVVLPQELREQLGWKQDDFINFAINNGKMILSKEVNTQSQ